MCPSLYSIPQRRQQGSALVIAIFVIVIMSILALALTRIGNNADDDVNLEVWSLRAFAAANSGADVALSQLFPVTRDSLGCSWTPPAELGLTQQKDAGWRWTPPAVLGFHGCAVSLSCSSQSTDESIQYRVTSTAVCETGDCSSGDSEQCLRVSRSVEVEARE
jgi:MSHA biogenesis protein MshP